jgi:hypothetical protein
VLYVDLKGIFNRVVVCSEWGNRNGRFGHPRTSKYSILISQKSVPARHIMHTTLKNIFSRAAQQPLNSRTPALSKRQRPLFAEQLEARRLLAADATVNLTGRIPKPAW